LVHCLSLKMLKLEINDILPLFCLARIKYVSWYLYDIYRIISYLRATVPTAENVVKFIYQSDNIFPYNLQATYPCINYISVKNKIFWQKRWLQFSYCELSVYIEQHSSRTCIRKIYLSFDTIKMSLWILSWLFLW